MTKNQQFTLFLWLQGMFPRRVNYWLLTKGLVSSTEDLLEGKTTDPNLSIVRLTLDLTTFGWISDPENEPLPPSISTTSPCLRIRDTETGAERWVRESSSIIEYLEGVYADRGPALKPKDILDITAMNDLVGQINLALAESMGSLRHASPQFATFSTLKQEERSRPAARVSYHSTMRGLLKVQDWARDPLATTGWLTPGTDGPGLVDVNLAAARRYVELTYGWNIFEKEELKPLEEWYGRFQKLAWWNGFEGRPNIHPPEFKFNIDRYEL
ncbi:hypothetical protein F4859DRAFT_527198 [Xylaria cf. heliscus]|nr:hypothetical protein F4859DRAFT_527198 [Xylaria cf. heliscus]